MAKATFDFVTIFNACNIAGQEAVKNAKVIPMRVSQHVNPFDDNSKEVYSEIVDDGVCGFASIRFKANNAWAKWVIANKLGNKSNMGGAYIWVGAYGQSLQKKEAYARAFATKLNEMFPKADAYIESRMD